MPDSQVVFADGVLSNTSALLFGSVLDIGRMTLPDMDRTERHWQELLSSVGLCILNIRHPTREEMKAQALSTKY